MYNFFYKQPHRKKNKKTAKINLTVFSIINSTILFLSLFLKGFKAHKHMPNAEHSKCNSYYIMY